MDDATNIELTKHNANINITDLKFDSIHEYCDYANNQGKNHNSNFLNIFQLNARSISNMSRFEDVKEFINLIPDKPQIILIGETWIASQFANLYTIPGYQGFFSCRDTDTHGGGIALFVHDSINADLVNLHKTDFNSIHLKIGTICKTVFHILAYYRPPQAKLDSFLEHLETNLDLSHDKPTIVLGDINLNTLFETDESRKYIDIMTSYGQLQCNKSITRNSSNTLLDHIFFNSCNEYETNTYTIPYEFSDHNAVLTNLTRIKFSSSPSGAKYSYRIKTKIDYKNVNAILSETLYSNSKPTTTNPNILYDFIITTTSNAIECSTTTKRIKIKTEQSICPWVTKNLEILHKHKDNLRKKLKHELRNRNDPIQISRLETRINIVSHRLIQLKQCCKQEYYQKVFNEENTSKQTWDSINSVLNRGNNHHNKLQKIYNERNELLTTNNDISTCFNNHFANVGVNLASLIPSQPDDNINKFNSIQYNPNSIFLSPVTETEIANLIKGINSNKSPGYDNIRGSLLKSCPSLIPIITELANLIINGGIYPDSLKVARVIPIHKTGDKKNLNNYRPISLLSVFNKIFESLISCRIHSFLEHNFFYKYQYGFRPKSNTTIAATELVDKLLNTIDKGKLASGLFLDLSKAFDTVDHQILLLKCEKAGIRGCALEIIASYLSNRKQFVSVNGSDSPTIGISCGVPQGSVLGPLLFLIYINDVSNLDLKGIMKLYADDTVLLYESKDSTSIVALIQNDLHIISEYYRLNRLTLNASKSKYIIFQSQHKTIEPHIDPMYNNIPIENVEKIKYLGLHLDKYLCWDEHINITSNKLSFIIYILKKLNYRLPRSIMKIIYFALFQSQLAYLLLLWGTASKTRLMRVQRLQNRALKTIAKLPLRTSTNLLFSVHFVDLLPIKAQYIQQICTLMYNIVKNNTHHTFDFTSNRNIHNHNTRTNLFKKPCVRTNYGKNRFTFSGPTEFNSLPEDLQSLVSLKKYKSHLKIHLKRNLDNFLRQ